MKTVFKIRNKEQGLRNKFFLVSLILIGSFVFFTTVQAEDCTDALQCVSTSTPNMEEELPTEISTEIIQEETPTSTLEIAEETPTSTLETETPTSTPTSTPEIITPTSTPTSTPEIETPTSTPTSTPEIETPTTTTTFSTSTTTTSTEQAPETSGGGSYIEQTSEPELVSDSTINQTIEKLLNYFKSRQDETGKIIDGNITDWAIMSFGADGQYADDIKLNGGKSLLEYEKKYNLDANSDLNPCASYPRHVLALLAAGVNTDDNAIIGLNNEINTCHVEGVYGQNGINDDIFALLALLALDTNTDKIIIEDILKEIKSWQLENGAFSWPDWFNPADKIAGDDITGAAVNALKYAQNKGAQIENDIFTNATNYLKTSQQSDGGWGWGSSDIMTTSWVLMGLNSLGETQTDWFTDSEKNPWHPLTEQLTTDGFYESAWVPGTVDWFAMKHAIPALTGDSWPIILDPIVEDFSEGATYTYGGGSSASVNLEPVIEEITTPTSTTISTSTPILDIDIPTSTLDLNIDLNDDSYTKITTTTRITTDYGNYGLTDEYTNTITDKNNNENVTQSLNFNNEVVLAAPITTLSDEDSTSSTEKNQEYKINNQQPGETLSAPSTTTIPYSKTAKGVFAGATSMAGALGLYLGWRFLQTLI
ncbi:MAG: prenyltransferase/squalene oxidase repeat-containing protein [Candidatus Magasanikbacteria bacterium]